MSPKSPTFYIFFISFFFTETFCIKILLLEVNRYNKKTPKIINTRCIIKAMWWQIWRNPIKTPWDRTLTGEYGYNIVSKYFGLQNKRAVSDQHKKKKTKWNSTKGFKAGRFGEDFRFSLRIGQSSMLWIYIYNHSVDAFIQSHLQIRTIEAIKTNRRVITCNNNVCCKKSQVSLTQYTHELTVAFFLTLARSSFICDRRILHFEFFKS